MISAYAFAASLVVLVVVLAQAPYATARLTRVVTRDTIGEPLRSWVRRKWGAQSMAAELIACHWCIGAWASILVNGFGWTLVALTGLLSTLTCVLLAMLAAPAVAYQASRMIDREDG